MSTGSQRATSAPRRNPIITILLTLLTLALLVLHHDWWFWSDATLIGFLPVGLAYHAAYCVACSILMWLLVQFAWPSHLETLEQNAPGQNSGDH